ncbi:MAG TPA: hypothetical protein VFV37_07770 [Luteibaculaceae bacterium]|nr:hypothetical protein [Luteibaculaceae bacterium]
MGIFRFIILCLVFYTIFKVLTRLIAPLFQGYYEKDRTQTKRGEGQQTRVNNIIIDTSKSNQKLDQKPNLRKLDAEDVDFEELK